jgi:hypothetical protein
MERPQLVTPPRRALLASAVIDHTVGQDVIMSQTEQDQPSGLRAARERTRAAGQVDGDLQLVGGLWPWRPTTMSALALAAATGVTLLLAAAARRHPP